MLVERAVLTSARALFLEWALIRLAIEKFITESQLRASWKWVCS
jgi:hypothetical protein